MNIYYPHRYGNMYPSISSRASVISQMSGRDCGIVLVASIGISSPLLVLARSARSSIRFLGVEFDFLPDFQRHVLADWIDGFLAGRGHTGNGVVLVDVIPERIDDASLRLTPKVGESL